MSLSRRTLLAAALASASALPGLSFARPGGAWPDHRRLLVVLLRGGLDGLAAVVPHGDPDYRRRRAGLALPGPGEEGGVTDLDGFFGLAPAWAGLAPLWQAGQLAFAPAVALDRPTRSHFDAQDRLECGGRPAGVGWLNRALEELGRSGAPPSAVALAPAIPLLLRGAAPVMSAAPSALPAAVGSFLEQVAVLYQNDPELGPLLEEALSARDMVQAQLGPEDRRAGRGARRAESAPTLLRSAARLLVPDDGPRVAVVELSGWDTHARQGASEGQLATRLRPLGRALAALPEQLGPHWKDTAVIVTTEFGRTVEPNGTQGTDHGTGALCVLLGGAVRGGVIGDWPGLAQLHEGRDLTPTLDPRALFGGVLAGLAGLDEAALRRVFPQGPAPLRGLVV